MKVLEKKEWSCETECKDCGSLLLVEADDIFLEKLCSYGDCDFYYRYVCGNCKIKQTMNRDLISRAVKNKAES